MAIPKATETFSDSLSPRMGIKSTWSQRFKISFDNPLFSLPRIKTADFFGLKLKMFFACLAFYRAMI